jgi:uncharacterized damage-inducible protein DinB
MQIFHGLDDLFRHMNWADSIVWQSVFKCGKAEKDERLRNLLYHIHTTQHAFFLIWSEKPVEISDISGFRNLRLLAQWGYVYHQQVAAYFNTINDQALERPLNIPWAQYFEERIGKPPEDATLRDTMLQVTSHSSYHRGQVNARLRELGEEPPLTDFIAWVWLGKPPAGWPEEVRQE